MIKVQFKTEVNGVTECNCHHLTPEGYYILIHFTREIFWKVEQYKVKQIG